MSTVDEERLSALRQLVPHVPTPPISDVYDRAARVRRTRTTLRMTGLVVVAVVGVLVFARGVPALRGPSPAATGSPHPSLSCSTAVTTGPLPVWARTGFTPPDQPIAHMTGTNGDIVGVLFDHLHAPTVGDQGNKILWVARVTGGSGDPDLKIHATLNGSPIAVDRVVPGGPGPSSVDVPQAGCWTFTLSWSGHHDQLAVPYS